MFAGSHKPTCTDRKILLPETCFGFFLMDTVIDIVVKKVCTARSAQASCRSSLRSHFGSSFLASNYRIAAPLKLFASLAKLLFLTCAQGSTASQSLRNAEFRSGRRCASDGAHSVYAVQRQLRRRPKGRERTTRCGEIAGGKPFSICSE